MYKYLWVLRACLYIGFSISFIACLFALQHHYGSTVLLVITQVVFILYWLMAGYFLFKVKFKNKGQKWIWIAGVVVFIFLYALFKDGFLAFLLSFLIGNRYLRLYNAQIAPYRI